MSETDDTDELILIPPDRFAPRDGLLGDPYFGVVDTLITQVTDLEGRISSIESFASSSGDLMPPGAGPVRKHRSSDDVTRSTRPRPPNDAFDSTQSTPQKPRGARRAASTCSVAPPRNPSLGRVGPDKRDVIGEEFRNGFVEDNAKQFTNHFSKNSLDVHDLDFMLRKVEEQQRSFEVMARGDEEKFGSAEETGEDRSDNSGLDETLKNSENASSLSDSTQPTTVVRLAAGSDFITASRQTVQQQQRSRMVSSSATNAYPYQLGPAKRDPFASACAGPARRNLHRTAYRPAAETSDTTTKGSESSVSNPSSEHRVGTNAVGGDYRTYDFHGYDDGGFARILEEDRVRRQRYEQIIQQLQKKIGDLQAQLANAVRVDEAKDDAILRFHKAWEQVAVRLQTLVNERNALEQEIKEAEEQHNKNFSQAAEKVANYEMELKRSHLLTQTVQEKNKELEKLIIDLTNEIQRLNNRIEGLERELKMDDQRNGELKDELARKDETIKEVEDNLSKVRNEYESERKKIEEYTKDFEKTKEDCRKFDEMLKEKDNVIEALEKQNQKLLTNVDQFKKTEKDLQKDLQKSKEFHEKEKLDLKYFYQEQVERVVKEKLLDFQVQLERARGELEGDLKKREVIVAKTAATHIQQIADKHSLEIRLLEEKHSEEVRLYQVQLSQAQQLVDNLQHKLQNQHVRKQHMARQLHKLMEAQWHEALKIINNGRSPGGPGGGRGVPPASDRAPAAAAEDTLADRLDALRSKSYGNMEEVLAGGGGVPEEEDERRGGTTTPLTSRMPASGVAGRRPDMEDVQNYIQFLMQKRAGSPVGDRRSRNGDGGCGEYATWQTQVIEAQEDARVKMKDKKIKPPWK